METTCKCYEWVGFIVLWGVFAWFLFKIAKGLWTSWIGSALGFGYNWKPGTNSWAIVTGSTDGIGLEYARELAKKGYSLLLISRSQEKLNTCKEEIKAKASKCKEIRTLVIDFSKTDVYNKIKDEISNLGDIDVLVNNVGISYTCPEYFNQLSETNTQGFLDSLINVNIIACTKMIELALPKMEKQKKGLIISISSLSAAYPCPLLAAYGATKIYVDSFSQALQIEYAKKGIVIQSVLPAYVATKMSRIRNSSLLVPSASQYVKGALKTVGLEDRTYGFWSHKLQGFVQDSFIAGVLGNKFMSNVMFSQLAKVRAVYYKKKVTKDK